MASLCCGLKRTSKKSKRYEDTEEIGILMMGMTGHGKSATGNAILRRDQFVSAGGWGSVTKSYHAGNTRFDGRLIKVVDVPGFGDSDEISERDKDQLVITALTNSLVKFPNGFHVVLLVVSYASRLTQETKEKLKYIFDTFDEKAFKSYGVLVVTNGDAFHRDNTKEENPLTIRQWLETNFPERLDACGGRCVLFDNVTKCEKVKDKQLMELFDQIDQLDNKDSLYIPEICRCKGNDIDAYNEDRERVDQNEQILSLLGLVKDGRYREEHERNNKEAKAQLEQDLKSLKTKMGSIHCRFDEAMLEKDTEINNLQQKFAKENTWGAWMSSTAKGVGQWLSSIDAETIKSAADGAKSIGSAIAYGVGIFRKW